MVYLSWYAYKIPFFDNIYYMSLKGCDIAQWLVITYAFALLALLANSKTKEAEKDELVRMNRWPWVLVPGSWLQYSAAQFD